MPNLLMRRTDGLYEEVTKDKGVPVGLIADARSGFPKSGTWTLGADIVSVALPDTAKMVIIKPTVAGIRWSMTDDPAGLGVSAFTQGGSIAVDTEEVIILEDAASRVLKIQGNTAVVYLEVR
jgi:hypothetical protein